jgi:2-keto-4-pentenoate hydratase
MELLHALGDRAASLGGVERASFVAGALRKLGVGLCKGNPVMYHACLGMLAKSRGTGFRAGMGGPPDNHGLL